MIDPAKYFSAILRKNLKSQIQEIILFGSRARGDFQENSDFDFLIIVKKKNKELLYSIREIEVNLLNKFNLLFASLIYEKKEWQKRKNLPIGINILREGKLIK